MTPEQQEALIYCLIEQHCRRSIDQGEQINLGAIFHKINTSLDYEKNLAMREVATLLEDEELNEAIDNKTLEALLLKGRKDYNEVIIRMMNGIKNNSQWKATKI
jgi:hypothetical protein